MEAEIIEVKQAEMLQAINRSEIDMQIATAKQYPRDLPTVLNKIETFATMDTETAEDCFYALPRQEVNGDKKMIEGLSIRMAEIIASAWGNLRVQSRIIGNDGRFITAQGICHDLETNVAVSKEVKRRITNKYGRTFSDDMQVVTGNAAASIALRNAILAVVPKAVIKKIIVNVRNVAIGHAIDLETGRQNAIATYAKAGVNEQMLFDYLGITKKEQIDKETLFELKGLWIAIKEGTTSVEEVFIKPQQERKAAEEAQKKAQEAKAKAAEAQNRQSTAKTNKPTETKGERVDSKTGEIFKEANK